MEYCRRLPPGNRFEVGAAVTTGLLFLLCRHLRLQGAFVPVAAGFWIVFIWYRARGDPAVLRAWGFRLDTFAPAFRAATAFSVPLVAAMALFGIRRGTPSLAPHVLVLLALYPVWGVVQQFLVQALLVRNLEGIMPKYCLIFAGSCLFAIVHIPDLPLMLATFGLGLVYVPLYLRHRNLWPLGLYHGWLGTFFYLWVLGRDPWVETFAHF